MRCAREAWRMVSVQPGHALNGMKWPPWPVSTLDSDMQTPPLWIEHWRIANVLMITILI
ncbi:hypothetical protein D9M68_968280 [compost metagenome]